MNIKEIIKELKEQNPYPELVFIELSGGIYQKVIELFKENGLSLDGYNGSFGRKVYNNCLEDLEERIEDAENEELCVK